MLKKLLKLLFKRFGLYKDAVVQEVKECAEDLVEDVKEEVAETISEVIEDTDTLVDDAKEKVEEMVSIADAEIAKVLSYKEGLSDGVQMFINKLQNSTDSISWLGPKRMKELQDVLDTILEEIKNETDK